MLISFIVPIYNVEKYLNECVDSILSQDFEDYEIILIDDGSTDNSGAICDEYARRYENIIVKHKLNGGLSDARNAGIELANGKYVLFVDSDDYIGKNSISAIVNCLNEQKKTIDVVFLDACLQACGKLFLFDVMLVLHEDDVCVWVSFHEFFHALFDNVFLQCIGDVCVGIGVYFILFHCEGEHQRNIALLGKCCELFVVRRVERSYDDVAVVEAAACNEFLEAFGRFTRVVCVYVE